VSHNLRLFKNDEDCPRNRPTLEFFLTEESVC